MKPLQVLDVTKLAWQELKQLQANGFDVEQELKRRGVFGPYFEPIHARSV